jgi:hypothetical protein
VLAQGFEEYLGHRALVLVHDRKPDLPAFVRAQGGGDDADDHERHQDQEEQRWAIPHHQEEVLQGDVEQAPHCAGAPRRRVVRRIRASSSSKDCRRRIVWNWLR